MPYFYLPGKRSDKGKRKRRSTIKLDFHFFTSVGDLEKGRIIVSYIIKMVRSLGMEIIAEGVENPAQADFLKEQGCSDMQGFYFYKPMPVHKFEELGDTFTV